MDDIDAGTLAQPKVSSLPAAETSGRTERALCLVMACALAGILIIEVILCLMPPVSRDALIHHLAIPKLWIRHGGFFETPWADFSYFPMNVDLLYLVPLLFGNDRVPAFIHLLFGWGTGYLVYRYLKDQMGKVWGLLGLLVFVSTPMVIRLSITAYVDLGMIFFTTASVLSYLRWRDGGYEDVKWLLLAAVCMGLAAGTKYNALISWLFLGGAVCFLYARDTGKQLQAIRWGLIFSLVALAAVSPWLVKNLILKGNPIYPLMDNVFSFIHGGRETAAFLAAGEAEKGGGYSLLRNRTLLYGEEVWQILLLPFRIFFEGRDHSPQHFDGVLNPLFALAIPCAFVGSQKGPPVIFFPVHRFRFPRVDSHGGRAHPLYPADPAVHDDPRRHGDTKRHRVAAEPQAERPEDGRPGGSFRRCPAACRKPLLPGTSIHGHPSPALHSRRGVAG